MIIYWSEGWVDSVIQSHLDLNAPAKREARDCR